MDLSAGQVLLLYRQTEVDMAEKALLYQEAQYSATAVSWLKNGAKIYGDVRAALMRMCGRDPATGKHVSKSGNSNDETKKNRKKLMSKFSALGILPKGGPSR